MAKTLGGVFDSGSGDSTETNEVLEVLVRPERFRGETLVAPSRHQVLGPYESLETLAPRL